jgi:hypothetical protein
MSSPANNHARISSLRSAIEAIRLQTFDLEQQLQPLEEWRRDAIRAIESFDGTPSADPRRSTEQSDSDTRLESSNSEDFDGTSGTSDDEPYRGDMEPKRPRSCRSPRPQRPPPAPLVLPPPAPPGGMIQLILSAFPALARLPPLEQIQVLGRVNPQLAGQLLRCYRQMYTTVQQA